MNSFACWSLALCAIAAAAVAEDRTQAGPPPAFAPSMGQLLDGLDAVAMFNGTVLVDRAGTVIYSRQVGKADYANDIDLAPDTRFRIASLSKLYSDAVVASLVEKELLSLDQTLDAFLPDFPGANKITISQILEHSSGIPHTNAQPWGDGSEIIPKAEIVRRLAQLPLDFEPGSDSRYSNGGYAVLVVALEKLTGLEWATLLEREVLGPLSLSNTGIITDSRAVIPRLALGYEPGPTHGSRRISRFYAVEMRPGGGDLYATADDVRRFFAAIWRGDFAGEAGEAQLRSREGPRFMTGRSPGFNTIAYYDPGEDVLIVSLANNYAADFNWDESLAAVALGRAGYIQAVPKLAARPWAPDARWLGDWRYEIERFSQELTIGQNADGSMYIDDGVTKTRSALLPLADGGFLETLYFGKCRWADTEDDRITCTRWYPEGFVADFVRR